MLKEKTLIKFISFILCVCVFLTGSANPFYAYAAFDGDDALYDDGAGDEVEVPDDSGDSGGDDSSAQQTATAIEKKYQPQINAIDDKMKALDAERKQIEANISKAKDEKARALAVKESLDREIAITRETIALLLERISVFEQDISEKQDEIEKKQGEVDESYQTLRKRLRAMYMQDTSTTLGLIVGSDSFSEMLTHAEYVKRIADHDRDLMARLTDQRLSLEEQKAELEEAKLGVELDKSVAEEKRSLLSTQVSRAQLQVQDLAQMEADYTANLAENKRLQDAAKAELDRIYQQIEWSKNQYIGGAMAWPIPAYPPGVGYVSCEFGPRFAGADYHTGIDLSGTGVYGHDIVAANAGTVVVANWTYTKNVGYGIYVMLDHGGKVSTLYGHCSNIVVKVGDKVKKGQKIAEVGSTGWSTGPHLHFEVRIDGKHQNPRSYLFGS